MTDIWMTKNLLEGWTDNKSKISPSHYSKEESHRPKNGASRRNDKTVNIGRR
jgi:hypothetical protein